MRVLVTRPLDDAAGLAEALAALGIETMIEPLLSIRIHERPIASLDGVQGFLATSANGVRALAANLGAPPAGRQLPLWAVGAASAAAAAGAGFSRVLSADGDVLALAGLVARTADPAAGRLLHAAASVLAGDLAGDLHERGFAVERLVLYESRPADSLSEALRTALKGAALDGALFFSPRTAGCFASLATGSGLAAGTRPMTAYALSGRVAEALAELPWRRVVVAGAPRQDALLALLAKDIATNTGMGTP